MITPALREALTKQGGAQLRILVLALSRAVGEGLCVGKGLPWALVAGLNHRQDTRNGWGWKGLWRSPSPAAPRQGPQSRWHRNVSEGIWDVAMEGASGACPGHLFQSSATLGEEVLLHVEVEFVVV